MIGKTIRNYRILSELSKGGMGIVYLAEHINLPRRFVVKCLAPALKQDPEFVERFYQEAQNQAMLTHPAIVQATDYFEDGTQFLFVMEYVDGQPLDVIIKARAPLSEKQALSIFRDVLEGLGFAHRKGIVHRDVKPSNILIDQNGKARIIDFGIAILAGSERLTSTGLTVGTAWYMSPEQIKEPKSIDHRSDIYSAGIVLYEMLTGTVPFDGGSDFSVKEMQINAAIPDPRATNASISPNLTQIVQKAMAKNPAKRFQTCSEFLGSIDSYCQNRYGEKTARSRWWLVAGVFVLGLAITAGLYLKKPLQLVLVENAMLENERESSVILVQGAAEKASLTCRELKEVDLKRQNLDIAKELGDTALVDAYTKQIEEINQNIHEHTAEYQDLIGKLAGIKKAVVEDAFDVFADTMLSKGSFNLIYATRMVQRNYQQRRGGITPENISLTRETCAERGDTA